MRITNYVILMPMMKLKGPARNTASLIIIALIAIIILGLVNRFIQLSVQAGSDFEVYWYAIHAWVSGKSPYAQYSTVYEGLFYKYPPWTLVFFLPFALVGLVTSKWVWTILQVLAIFYCNYWVTQHKVRWWIALSVSLMFWWMWLAHGIFGQVMLFLMVVALWVSKKKQGWNESFQLALLVDVISAKVFSALTLVGVFKRLTQWRTLFCGLLFLVLSHLLLILVHPAFDLNTGGTILTHLYQGWFDAASSGGAKLGGSIVRGQQNHGFTKVILNLFQIGPEKIGGDIGIALLLSLTLGFLWNRYSKKLSFEEKWSGWLALGVICHPLAWHHSFVAAFPLCAFSLNRAVELKKASYVLSVLFGIACIGIFIPQIIGVSAVIPIEAVSNKSWGVVICGISLILMSNVKTKKGVPIFLAN